MAVKNITMKEYNGSDYDELHPKTTPEQIDGVMSIEKGGTGATTASGARSALGLKSLATTDIAQIGQGGTGQTEAFVNFTIENLRFDVFKSYSAVARYYPYLRLVYLDINTTPSSRIDSGSQIVVGSIAGSSETLQYIPKGRRALSMSTVGNGVASVYMSPQGNIELVCKQAISATNIISITGMYHI